MYDKEDIERYIKNSKIFFPIILGLIAILMVINKFSFFIVGWTVLTFFGVFRIYTKNIYNPKKIFIFEVLWLLAIVIGFGFLLKVGDSINPKLMLEIVKYPF